MERFEAEHWSCNPLDEPVILFDYIVEIFGLNDPDGPASSRESEDNIETLQASQIGTAFVDGNAIGDAICINCTLKEPPCGSGIPAL